MANQSHHSSPSSSPPPSPPPGVMGTWMDINVAVGDHFYDRWPPSYHRNQSIKGWWHLDCHTCGRHGHTSRGCDQQSQVLRCIYCGTQNSHKVQHCPLRTAMNSILAQERAAQAIAAQQSDANPTTMSSQPPNENIGSPTAGPSSVGPPPLTPRTPPYPEPTIQNPPEEPNRDDQPNEPQAGPSRAQVVRRIYQNPLPTDRPMRYPSRTAVTNRLLAIGRSIRVSLRAVNDDREIGPIESTDTLNHLARAVQELLDYINTPNQQ